MKRILIMLLLSVAGMLASRAAEVSPSYPGGEEAMTAYITTNLQYPPIAKENGVEGVVVVAFTVKADGSIGNIKIKRMVDPDLEAEAIRLVKNMPKWTPASSNGAAVESQAEVNISFSLE